MWFVLLILFGFIFGPIIYLLIENRKMNSLMSPKDHIGLYGHTIHLEKKLIKQGYPEISRQIRQNCKKEYL